MDQIKSKKHVFSKLFPFFKPYLIPLIGGFVLIFFAAVFTAAASHASFFPEERNWTL